LEGPVRIHANSEAGVREKHSLDFDGEMGHWRNIIRKVLREESYGYSQRGHQQYPVLSPLFPAPDS
jgi:hypothetical protein